VIFALRSPSPVGHFTSAASQDRFLAAYDRAPQGVARRLRQLDGERGAGRGRTGGRDDRSRHAVVRFEAQLTALDIPVLAIIAGASGMHNSAEGAETARRLLDPGEVKVYPEASHAINGEYPEEIAADISGLLSRIDP
jgi:pimeloyl-ACP methyl ester carboxylesterase